MTPSARVQAAIEVLDRIFGGVPAEQALTGWARGARYAGSGDRAAVRDHVFDGLRQLRSATARAGAEALSGRAVMIGLLGRAGAEALFTGAPHAPGVLTEAEAGRDPRAGGGGRGGAARLPRLAGGAAGGAGLCGGDGGGTAAGAGLSAGQPAQGHARGRAGRAGGRRDRGGGGRG